MNLPESNEPPPPPYTETDIFSNAGSGSRSSDGRTPATSQAAPSVAGESASRSRPPTSLGSSQSDVVYTPPLTPRTANTHDASLPPSSSAAAAEAYFESRPTRPDSFPGAVLSHTVTVTPASRPDDFPFPESWAARDVLPADWQTFLNFLLPAHTTTSNEEVISRKLRAEEESLANATAGLSSSSGRSHASAQLEHLRTSQAESATSTVEARREAASVALEWNQGFFLPRHLSVHLVYEAPSQAQENQRPQMPGTWESGSDHNTPQHRHQGPYQPPPHPPPPLVGPPHGPLLGPPHFSWGPGYQQPSRSGFSFAGIRMNDDGLYIGNSLAADRNGFRLGGLVADTNGLRYRDNVVVGPGMFSGGPNPEYPGTLYHPSNHPPPMGSQPGFSPQSGQSPGAFPPAQSPFHEPCPTRPNLSRGPSDSYPYPQKQAPPRRSRSGSSVSSKSESSSSTSSLGSLPDYDELDDAQIPVYRSTLQNWLVTPERPVTKQDVQRLRAELREAKRKQSEYPPGTIDKKALRAEIKALKQEWRALRRTQRSVRREARRQRRSQRRMEKRERRDSRQAQKQAERHHRHARGPGSWGSPNVPPPGMGRDLSGPGFLPSPGPPPPGSGPWGVPPLSAPPFGFAPGFGRGFGPGPGQAHRPSFPVASAMPGAWRSDEPKDGSQDSGQGASPRQGDQRGEPLQTPEAGPVREPHKASQAKFRQLDEMEKELARKMDQAFETRAGVDKTDGKEEKGGKEKSKKGSLGNVQTLETEVDELMRRVEKLRMEADETFARELEEEERRLAGGGGRR